MALVLLVAQITDINPRGLVVSSSSDSTATTKFDTQLLALGFLCSASKKCCLSRFYRPQC